MERGCIFSPSCNPVQDTIPVFFSPPLIQQKFSPLEIFPQFLWFFSTIRSHFPNLAKAIVTPDPEASQSVALQDRHLLPLSHATFAIFLAFD